MGALFNDTDRFSMLLTWHALGGAKQSGDTPDFGIPNQRCYIAGKRCIAWGRVQCFTKNGQLLSDPSSCVALVLYSGEISVGEHNSAKYGPI